MEAVKGHLDLLLLAELERGAGHGYALIERLRTPGEVHVYGVSYGTQLVLRMMQVAPPELDSLVLVGLVPPESEPHWDLSHRTRVVDAVGRSLLTHAQRDRYAQLLAMDPAPWQETLSGGDLRQFMGALLNFPSLRGRIPDIVDSLLEQRTELLAETVADLQHELARLTPYPQSAPSLPLVGLISASENNSRRDLTTQTVTDEANPNYEPSQDNLRRLRGAGLEVVELPWLPYAEGEEPPVVVPW
jgi:pimeloyl-ACP methyl ester carboxylesterase